MSRKRVFDEATADAVEQTFLAALDYMVEQCRPAIEQAWSDMIIHGEGRVSFRDGKAVAVRPAMLSDGGE